MTGLVLASLFMFVLLMSGLWVAMSLGVAGMVGLYQVLGFERVITAFGKIAWEINTNFILVALPLFIFMGEILFQAGVMTRIYNAANRIVSALPGGLLQTNVAASTLFAACSGSSLASAATIGSVGYPQIIPKGYDRRLALGSIAAGGTLGILIPPSVIFIVYGSLAEVSIGKLFLAGVVPGLLLASFYGLYIVARALADARVAPREHRFHFLDAAKAVAELWELVLLAVVILGGIYGGVASPTEVAGLGAVMALIIALVRGRVRWPAIHRAALTTVRQTTMIVFIITTAKLFALTLIYYQLPNKLVAWAEATGTSPLNLVLGVCLLYLVMGMFFDGLSMMVITIPFVVPMMSAVNVDLIWLGVLICMMIEIGLLTPPVGLNLFVLQGATGEPIRDIVMGSLPFIVLLFVTLALVMVFPAVALYLPSLM